VLERYIGQEAIHHHGDSVAETDKEVDVNEALEEPCGEAILNAYGMSDYRDHRVV
jgi:hypothetical protein